MMAHVFLNNRLMTADKACIPVFDRGFTYGDALFETVKIAGGRPVFFEEHLKRLAGGMLAAGFSEAPDLSAILSQTLMLAQKNGIESGRLRIMVTRGTPVSGAQLGPDPAGDMQPTWLITVQEFSGASPQIYEKGVSCATTPANRGRYAGMKTTGLMSSILARREAHETGAWEAILTDGQGRMLEGAYTNIFFLAEKILVTAAETDPILPGIVRQKVIEMAPGLGMATQFHAPRMEELGLGATSAFLTSSLLGICPVYEIDGVKLRPDTGPIGLLRKRLAQLEEASVS